MQQMEKVDMCLDDIIKSNKNKKSESLGTTKIISKLKQFSNSKYSFKT